MLFIVVTKKKLVSLSFLCGGIGVSAPRPSASMGFVFFWWCSCIRASSSSLQTEQDRCRREQYKEDEKEDLFLSFFFILLGGGEVRVPWINIYVRIHIFLLFRSNVSSIEFYCLRRPIPALICLGLRHEFCSGGCYVISCSCLLLFRLYLPARCTTLVPIEHLHRPIVSSSASYFFLARNY